MKTIANCKRCKDRSICITPCEALIKDLQEHIPSNKKELYIGTPEYAMEKWLIPEPGSHLTRMEKVILTLELFRFPREVIAKLFKIKRESVRKYIYTARKKLLRKS